MTMLKIRDVGAFVDIHMSIQQAEVALNQLPSDIENYGARKTAIQYLNNRILALIILYLEEMGERNSERAAFRTLFPDVQALMEKLEKTSFYS